jgi:hypothetical protein
LAAFLGAVFFAGEAFLAAAFLATIRERLAIAAATPSLKAAA